MLLLLLLTTTHALSNIKVDSIRNCLGTINPVVSCLRIVDSTAITWPPPTILSAVKLNLVHDANLWPAECSRNMTTGNVTTTAFSATVARGMHGAELEVQAWYHTHTGDVEICSVAPRDPILAMCLCHDHTLVWNDDSFDLFAVDPADP